MNTTFDIYNTETASDKSKELLRGIQKRFGQIPNLFGVLAEAPIAVEAYDILGQLLTKSSFTPTERHVIWFTINAYHECYYCMAAHTFLAKGEKVSEEVIETARAMEAYEDTKLEILRTFTLNLVENRGWVNPKSVEAFITAGFTKQNILEILVAISHKVLSNYTNHLANTPVDDVFSKFSWEKPRYTTTLIKKG